MMSESLAFDALANATRGLIHEAGQCSAREGQWGGFAPEKFSAARKFGEMKEKQLSDPPRREEGPFPWDQCPRSCISARSMGRFARGAHHFEPDAHGVMSCEEPKCPNQVIDPSVGTRSAAPLSK